MARRVLVTGATGFIGSWLCRALLEAGHSVRALHRVSSPLDALQGLPVERVVGDILVSKSLPPAVRGVEWVFHTAGQAAYWRHPEAVVEVAVEGTRNVVRAALEAGVRRLVLTSSLAAMGVPNSGELLTERHTFNLAPQQFPYGYAKRQAEIEALKAAARRLEVVIVNPSVVLGPGDRNRISGSLVIEVAQGKAFFWIEGGMNIVDVRDVVAGHLAAAERGGPGERYILGGENLTHREVLSTVAEVVGRPPPRLRVPDWMIGPGAVALDALGKVVALPLDGRQLRMSRHLLFCDTRKARTELGLVEARPFRRAVEETYAWYREQGIL